MGLRGLTVDLDRCRLVWFDIPAANDPRRRSLLLALLVRTWPGWSVEYAARGLGDVAEAAGVPRGRVGDPGPEVRSTDPADLVPAVDPPGMPEALDEFLDDFAGTHATDNVHPAIVAMNAFESALGLPARLLNPALADHHPLAADPRDVAAVLAHVGDLKTSAV